MTEPEAQAAGERAEREWALVCVWAPEKDNPEGLHCGCGFKYPKEYGGLSGSMWRHTVSFWTFCPFCGGQIEVRE